VCERAARDRTPVYFYGSRPEVLEPLVANLRERFPGLEVAGSAPSRFAKVGAAEKRAIAEQIVASGARIVFVGLGCPRQEVFAYEFGDLLSMPVLAVGAAFDYHAGLLAEPPAWMQRHGLQWLYRLRQEPRRLWRRYLTTNTQFIVLLFAQATRLWRPRGEDEDRPIRDVGYA
jgi:exopolysaccharide biosynthesis WecB/TagA/CpsF family protein